MQYVHKLAEAAMAEMRALILELRPDTLAREGLVAALERQVYALRSRHGLDVHAEFDGEANLTLDQKEALYRIAQEGIHNALKHARAVSLTVSLRRTDDGVLLEIEDDGVGFDPGVVYPGHLGLTSMRERAAAAGGQLEITSGAGLGTRISVHLPAHS
jgi:signal transduction histidine kinase